jgi:uncharacterized repeat protein (TIGR03803 family)
MTMSRRFWFIRTISTLVAGAALGGAAVAQVALSSAPAASAAYKRDYSFDSTHGSTPNAQLLQTRSGKFYGTTQNGGAYGVGTVFKFDPAANTSTVIHSFIQDGADGFQPVGNLIEDEDGEVYGTTSLGGAYSSGTVFRLSGDAAYQVVHAFKGDATDGAQSYSALLLARNGGLYGTTSFGGANGQGCVFRLASGGNVTILHSFAGPDGSIPQEGLTLGPDGALYGTTVSGGANDAGTIYKVTTAGAFTSLYSVNPSVEGVHPSHLTLARNGEFYATTPAGGSSNGGTVFSMNLAGRVTVLHDFNQGTAEGDSPSWLIQANDGNFWGVNANFGSDQVGTVFKMTPAGLVTTVHRFAPGSAATPNDGRQALAPPMQARSGVLYGLTSLGGIAGLPGYGTIYQITNP